MKPELEAKVNEIKEGTLKVVAIYANNPPNSVTGAIKLVYEAWDEVSELLEDVKDVMSLEDKQEVAVDLITYVYNKVNPDIPYIPELVENRIETFVLSYIVPALVEWADDKLNGNAPKDVPAEDLPKSE